MSRIAITATALVLAACSSGGMDTDGNGTGANALTATIDGSAWSAIVVATNAVITGPGNYSITGSNAAGTALSLSVYNIATPGTYPIGVGPLVFGGSAVISGGGGSWGTPLSGAAGTVTVTAVSATHITGDFSFDAPPTIGSGATKHVTGGHFNLPVTGTGSVTVPDQNGSKTSGTVGGTAFNAATIVFGSNPSSGTLGLAFSNTSYTINVIVSGFTGLGSYVMGTASQAASRTASVTATDGTNRTWGFSNANTSGTFAVTSYSATRMKGNYNITLQGLGSTAGSVALIGTFDIGFQQLTGLRR